MTSAIFLIRSVGSKLFSQLNWGFKCPSKNDSDAKIADVVSKKKFWMTTRNMRSYGAIVPRHPSVVRIAVVLIIVTAGIENRMVQSINPAMIHPMPAARAYHTTASAARIPATENESDAALRVAS